MRTKASVFAATLLCLAPLAPARATECIVSGYAATFGVDATGFFEVSPGESCHHAFSFRGVLESSKIAKPAQHGTVRMIDVSSFEYTPRAGFTGTDSFVIEASGESQTGKGRSLVTMSVAVK